MIALTAVHVFSGTLAVLAGAIAALTRKGGSIHVRTGRAFVLLMTVSSLLGAAIGLIKFEQFFITFFAGLLGAYLVVSGWLTLNRSSAFGLLLDRTLTVTNVTTFLALMYLGLQALGQPDGAIFGFAGENYLFLAIMSGGAMIGDLIRLLRKAVSRKHLIARHLWRMLLGFFIAAGSAFTGPGASIFPAAIQTSGVLSLPELIIFVLMIFYLVKILAFSNTTPS